MTTSTPPPRSASPAVWLIVHGVLWLAAVLALVILVPRFKRVFQEFGMKMPDLAQRVIDLSDLAAAGGFALPVILIGLLALDWFVLDRLGRRPGCRGWRTLWAVALTASPLLLLAVIALTLWYPTTALQNAVGP
jgi:hypothetical protein